MNEIEGRDSMLAFGNFHKCLWTCVGSLQSNLVERVLGGSTEKSKKYIYI